ncbi:MAG TPA: sugar transferase [Terriglobia bacterium]|nr:sugar transferase [Terriglobia bacterium]
MTNKPALLTAKKDVSRNGTRILSSARAVPFRPSDLMQRTLPEDLFLGILCLERKRSERSRKKFLLLLIDAEEALSKTQRKSELLAAVIRAADASRRETDPAGWYKERAILGIIFTELGAADDADAVRSLQQKAHANLAAQLNAEELQRVRVSIHMFGGDSGGDGIVVDSIFYPDLIDSHDSRKVPFVLKRVMDIVGSLAAIILLSPLFLLIAIAIKATSKGPILFKQERLGQFGKTFTCLKFRSMKPDSSPKIHQEFITQVIKGTSPGITAEDGTRVYKMTRDPRVTFIGRLIRRTSLDELPQFFNVLKGEMSLVGPRPPIAYEVREYDVWHRRRILEVKPGITGLWQVSGRSRVCFDDMVRLDLQYARGWSLWLDLRILLATPRAVAFGNDAY